MTDSDLTQNAFLGGALHLWQPARGYRAGIDPVLLAASAPVRSGQSVLDMGCGVGTACLCLGTRVAGLTLTGIELQPDLAALARRNGQEAGQHLTVYEGDIAAPPAALTAQSFDHVLMNPPFFERGHGPAVSHPGREVGRELEAGDLPMWMTMARKRLRQGGVLTMIHRTESLDKIMQNLTGFGGVEVQPLSARAGRNARLVLIRATKARKSASILHNPLVMHLGPRHMADGDDYTPEISAVLRGPAPLAAFGKTLQG
ncbi:methyltransferase [Alphaproteobacteria bacterium KMM 3653]|uniref:Methyltransferase n=1 Tax=Harenicola maris TaxID=2841044 RepID=A0AAP2CSW3_9RHOB|nr:methyltransferase [Harenicola maris]